MSIINKEELIWDYELARIIDQCAKKAGQRTGQYLFNSLPPGAERVVASTLFDPYHKEMTRSALFEWISHHLIFDDRGDVIAVFNNNDILWEYNGED